MAEWQRLSMVEKLVKTNHTLKTPLYEHCLLVGSVHSTAPWHNKQHMTQGDGHMAEEVALPLVHLFKKYLLVHHQETKIVPWTCGALVLMPS